MTTCIDNEERLHLALRASFDGDHHTAILHLKELLKDEPEHAEALYLLAIQHAELGLFDRAIAEMQRAVHLQPDLESARFQLGLLLMERGRLVEAKQHFHALRLSADRVLRTCADAMLSFAAQDLRSAKEKLASLLSPMPRQDASGSIAKLMYDVFSGEEDFVNKADVSAESDRLRAH